MITTHPIARMEQDNVLFDEFEKLYGGMWDLEIDPIKHAHKMKDTTNLAIARFCRKIKTSLG